MNVYAPPFIPKGNYYIPIVTKERGVQCGNTLTKLDLLQYELFSHVDDFWSGDIRHVGIQVISKEIKSDLFSHTDARISYSSVLQGTATPLKKVPKPSMKTVNSVAKNNYSDEDEDNGNPRIDYSKPYVAQTLGLSNSTKKSNKNSPKKAILLSDFVFNATKPSTSKQTKNNTKSDEKLTKTKKINKVQLQGNILDSSAPQLHKGKHRENAKKKPSTLKKIILKEREDKKNNETDNRTTTDDVPQISQQQEQPQHVQTSKNLHSRNFRTYCDHVLNKDLNEAVLSLLSELRRFQDRQHAKDSEKAKLKRRMVYGLREVKTLVKVEKIKCLIMAPNIENIQSEGGLNDMLADILEECRKQNVPYMFALNRTKLGYVTFKHRPLSCVGILNYQGADQYFKRAVEVLEESRAKYQELKLANLEIDNHCNDCGEQNNQKEENFIDNLEYKIDFDADNSNSFLCEDDKPSLENIENSEDENDKKSTESSASGDTLSDEDETTEEIDILVDSLDKNVITD